MSGVAEKPSEQSVPRSKEQVTVSNARLSKMRTAKTPLELSLRISLDPDKRGFSGKVGTRV